MLKLVFRCQQQTNNFKIKTFGLMSGKMGQTNKLTAPTNTTKIKFN